MDATTVTAETAQRLLDVRPETLYAYVSRGKIRSIEGADGAGDRREKRYLLEDIQGLLRRKAVRRAPDQAGEQALHYGLPILKTSLSRLTETEVFIRGESLSALSREIPFEAFCGWLWLGDRSLGTNLFSRTGYPQVTACGGDVLDALQANLPALEASDPRTFDHRLETVAAIGAGIIKHAAMLISGHTGSPPWDRPVAEILDQPQPHLLNTILILAAEHELNASAFTARCVASTGAGPYAAVNAGLCALRGPRHGGATLAVETLLKRVAGGEPGKIVTDYLKQAEAIPGFGHRVYRGTDPRAKVLLDLLESFPRRQRAELPRVKALIHAMELATGLAPNFDLALVTAARMLRAPAGTALRWFCLARIAGFIAHTIEQYQDGRLLRPRAQFEA